MRTSRRKFLAGSVIGFALLFLLSPKISYGSCMQSPKFVDVDGIKTRYFEGGSGETLVLVHGGQFGSIYSADVWSLNFDILCEHFHVYAFDKLGQGYTDNPKTDAEYTMTAVIEHTYQFLRTVGVQRANLLGHSRGALPVARIAVDHPELVKNLIILDSSTLAPYDPDAAAAQRKMAEEISANAPPTPTREFLRREPEYSSYLKDHITDEFIEKNLKIALLPKMAEARRKSQLPDVGEVKNETLDLIKAGHLKADTLIIWGLNDRTAPYSLGIELMKIISSVVDRTQLHIFNQAGHYVYREHPLEVDRLIVEFIKSSSSN